MPRAALVELDFFGLEKQTTASGPPEHRWTSSPGMVAGARSGYVHDHIRSGIPSSANPTIPSVENAVQFAPCDPFFVSLPASSFKRDHPNGFPAPTPAHSPLLRPTSDKNARIAPMTIFYNGKMTVVDVPRIMAENILKLAMEECSKNPESEKPETAMPAPSHQHQWFESLNKYLPMARRKSLQRFLEKRKERLTAASPYHDPAHLPPRVSGFKN